jgi:hypothetical protein
MELLGDVGQTEAHFSLFGDYAILDIRLCTVCAEHAIGLEFILGAPDGTPW